MRTVLFWRGKRNSGGLATLDPKSPPFLQTAQKGWGTLKFRWRQCSIGLDRQECPSIWLRTRLCHKRFPLGDLENGNFCLRGLG